MDELFDYGKLTPFEKEWLNLPENRWMLVGCSWTRRSLPSDVRPERATDGSNATSNSNPQ